MESLTIDPSLPDEEPIHFVAIDSSGKFFVQEEALAMIKSIKKKIAVITVAGQYRTGKSYLLNRLLGRQSGFELGSTINPCTKGLWIWSKPITINDNLQAIFLDTEGLASLSRNVHVDTMIFALSLLLSSYFIYNSMHALNEKALESLGLVVSLSKYIHVNVRPGNVCEDLEEYSQYFPYFMWVIRDFALKLVNTEQQTVTDRQYLENALRPVDPTGGGDPDQIASKNEIRGKLTTFFKERDCITMVRPLSDEKTLRNIDKVPYETLRPEFRTKMELLIKKIFNSIQPKIIDGQPLTGEMFATLLEQYIEAFNGGTVPTIETAWDQVITLELDRVIAESIEEYKRKIADLSLDRLPMLEEEIKKVDEEAKRTAYKKFYDSGLVNVGAERMSMARTKMEESFLEIYKKLRNENYNLSYKDSEELFNKLYGKIKEQMDTLNTLTYDVVASNWLKLKEVIPKLKIVLP